MSSESAQRTGTGPASRVPSLPRWTLYALDVALAAAVLVVEAGPILSGAPPWAHRDPTVLDMSRLAGFSAPLVLRRRFPVAVLAIVVVSFAGSDLLGAGLVVAFYSVGAWCDDVVRSRLAAVAGAGAVAAVFVIDRGAGIAPDAFLTFAVFGGAWYLGELSRARRRYTAVLEEHARTLEAERERDRQAAAAEERSRIARDLHDIVAHRVSMMTVQAGAANVVAAQDPDAAHRAIAAVEEEGRRTLSELRTLLGVLRAGDSDAAPTAPRPGLDRLHDLVADVRASGTPVRVTVAGEQRTIPEAVDISSYRILQEALTNVVRHAGPGAEAEVVVRYERDALHLSISDTGSGHGDARDGGHGLIGMRERAAAFGGSLEAGPRLDGGFLVEAVLPLQEPDA